MLRRRTFLAGAMSAALPVGIAVPARSQSASVSPAEARAIAQEAYIYGFPLVDSYRILYGNSKEEAIYPVYFTDSSGKVLTGTGEYTIHFAADGLPPVNAFWSLTMYKLPSSLLIANPLHRYLINSPMLPDLKRDADGGITIYVQNASPGKDKEANWLPAPVGPFFIATRLYWPKQDALDGKWKAPPLERAS